MPISSMPTLANRTRSSRSPGGNRVYLSEARDLISHAKRNDILSKAERDVLEKVLSGGNLTPAARNLLEETLRDGSSPTPSTSSSASPSPLEMNSNGTPTLNGRPSKAAWVHCAQQLADDFRSNQTHSLKATPLEAKEKLLEQAIELLNDSLDGSSASQRQQRSSAFTVAFAVTNSLPKARGTNALRKKANQALLNAATAETHPRLARHMVRLIQTTAFRRNLNRSEKTLASDLFTARYPQSYDVGHILDDDGYIQWEHNVDSGENMYRSFLTNVKATPIGGARFELVNKDADSADFEVTFKRPRGENKRVKGIRVHVKLYKHDMFDSLEKPVGISFGGHSDTGNNQEKSVARALSKGVKATEPRFVYLDVCAGVDGLDDALELLGNVEVLTTLDSSLYTQGKMKDERGNFKGIDTSEMQPTLFAIWEGLSREENYSQMRNRVKKVINPEDHPYHPNYIFGTAKDYKEVRWAHLDGDDDGVADALDLHYQFGLTNPKKSINFKLIHNRAPSGLNGDTVRDAVVDLNVSTHYHAFTHHNPTVVHNFVSGGFFDGKDSSDLVRFYPARNTDGKWVIGVQVNSGLAHTSREALGALVHYAAMLQMLDSGAIDYDMNESDRKTNALVFACARLICDGGNKANDKRIWRELLKALGLPKDLPYIPLAKRLNKEHNDYTGNMSIARGYKRHMSPRAKAAMKDPSSGRVTNALA